MQYKKIVKKCLIISSLVFILSHVRNEKVWASSELSIIGQPESVLGEVGMPISIRVMASGDNLKYQWEYYNTSIGAWIDYTGQTEASLNASIYADWDGIRFRCRITDAANNAVLSDEATVTIVKGPEITVQPKPTSGAVGTPVNMRVEASGDDLKYQWEYYNTGIGAWIDYTGPTEASLNAPIYADWNGIRFRCRIIDAANNTVLSDEATVFIINNEEWELPII